MGAPPTIDVEGCEVRPSAKINVVADARVAWLQRIVFPLGRVHANGHNQSAFNRPKLAAP